eukprot:scaffold40804_cov46-Phaeocystis_antarctica.AAC.3
MADPRKAVDMRGVPRPYAMPPLDPFPAPPSPTLATKLRPPPPPFVRWWHTAGGATKRTEMCRCKCRRRPKARGSKRCHRRRNPPATTPSSAAARCDTRHVSGHGRRCEEGDGRQRASRRTPRARQGACNHAALC